MTELDHTVTSEPFAEGIVFLPLSRRTHKDGTTSDGFDLIVNRTGQRIWMTADVMRRFVNEWDNPSPTYTFYCDTSALGNTDDNA